MTLKVRDEEDIIEDNLRFHRALGVDFFVVMDNGSVDRTPEILARYADAGLAHVLRDETGDLRGPGAPSGTREWAGWRRREFGADWVIHNDADEFWWPRSRATIKDALAADPGAASARSSPRARSSSARPDGPGLVRGAPGGAREALEPPAEGRPPRATRTWWCCTGAPTRSRAAANGDLWRALRPPGRAVHRSVRRDAEDEPAGRPRGHSARLGADLAASHLPLPAALIRAVPKADGDLAAATAGFATAGRFRRLR